MFRRIARITYARPKWVLAGTVAFVAAAIVLGGNVADRLKPAGFTDPSSESAEAVEQAAEMLGHDPSPGIVVLARAPDGDVSTPAARAEIKRLARVVASDPDVGAVRTPFQSAPARELISRDGRSALILGHFSQTDQADLEEAAERIPPKLRSETLDITVGGFAIGFNDVNDTVREDLERAELIAFPILALLLVLVFRGLVAAALPLLIGGLAVVGTFLSLRVLSEFTEISIFALNITTALGLGLAVDYGLLLVSRYREELARSGPGWEAHRRTVETAGRAIFFSGLTVAAASMAMVVLPQRFLYSMGAGAATVSLLAAFGALFATPAMLALLGERVNALSLRQAPPPPPGTGRWFRLARAVMRRPVPVAVGVTVVLAIAALPMARAVLVQPGNQSVPEGRDARTVTDTIDDEFTPNVDSPITATVPQARAERVSQEIGRLEGVRAVSRAAADGRGPGAPSGDSSGRAAQHACPGHRALDSLDHRRR